MSIIEQHYTNCLAQGAYYLESEGEAAIIDPLRDVDEYIELAKQRNVTITYVFETHFHADFVSGHKELAEKTGAKVVFGPTDFTPSYEVIIAKDGEKFTLGACNITVLHTPGHTMESSCYLFTDEHGLDKALFTGDTLFIGDVGRPDLAQKINGELTKDKLAGLLYESLHKKILPLSNDIIIYPGHGKGSACGKLMSDKKRDTLGNQKRVNYALNVSLSKKDFVQQVLSGLMPPPGYFPYNVLQNMQGAKPLDVVKKNGLQFFSPEKFYEQSIQTDVFVLDVRSAKDFSEGHVPKAINIGLNGDFAIWVGTIFEKLETKLLIVCDENKSSEVLTRLARIGFDNVLGFLEGGMEKWEFAGLPLNFVTNILPEKLVKEITEETILIDVRKTSEYKTERVLNALHIPLNYIQKLVDKVPKNKEAYVYCAAGYRSMIFISYLKQLGFNNLVNIEGGFNKMKELKGFDLSMYNQQESML